MLKRKRGNQGFTLIEMIIAISIFTIVIGIGYTILNKANVSMGEQQVITNDQMNANLVNKYLTKDLKECKDFKELEYVFNKETGDIEYGFIITKESNNIKNNIEYKVDIDKDYYDLTRLESGREIELVNNQPKSSSEPFWIKKNDSRNIYTVSLDNFKKENEKYIFDVSSRITLNDDNNSKPEEKPEDKFNEYSRLTFWINNISNSERIIMGVTNPNAKHGIYKQSKNTQASTDNIYNISASINLNNTRKQDVMSISSNNDIAGGQRFQTQNLKKTVNQIVIYVSEGAKLELRENTNYSFQNIKFNNGIVLLQSGMYIGTIKDGSNPQSKLRIDGTIYKGQTNSYVDVLYGNSK